MNPADVQDRLQQALGDAYVIERELGGGVRLGYLRDEVGLVAQV